MTLAAPIALLALLVIPALAGVRLARPPAPRPPRRAPSRRRARRHAAARGGGTCPRRCSTAAAVALAVALAQAAGGRRRAGRAGRRRARHRPLGLDGRRRRRSRRGSAPPRPPRARSSTACPDDLLVGFAGFSTGVDAAARADHRPRRGARRGRRADGRRRHRHRRRADGRARPARGRARRRRRRRSCCCPTARPPRGRTRSAAARRAAKLHVPIYTVALGTSAGTVYGPNGEPISVPPDPRDAAGDRDDLRRHGLRGRRRAGARRRLQAARLAHRHAQGDSARSPSASPPRGLVLLGGGLGTGLRRRARLV